MCSDFEIAGILPLMLLDDLYSSSSEEEIHPTPKRRRWRRKDNPFQVYTEEKFKRRFQMSKESVRRLHDLVKESLQRREKRGGLVSSMTKLLLTLHHLGSVSFQRNTGDILQLS